ncbi:MAG: hypothetical protein WKF84_18160 [Pyrinomonadaceae bacterium]
MAILGAAVALVYGVTLLVLQLGGSLMAHIGEGKVHIISSVMGIISRARRTVYSERHHRFLRCACQPVDRLGGETPKRDNLETVLAAFHLQAFHLVLFFNPP